MGKTRPPRTLYDRNLEKQAGFKPLYINSGYDPELMNRIEGHIQTMDKTQHNQRYKWYCLPFDLNQEEVESFLYQKYQLAGFYYEKLDKFYLLPFALSDTIDVYGRYNGIMPVQMGSTNGETSRAGQKDEQIALDKTLILKVVKTVLTDEEEKSLTYDDIIHSAVILRDYTPPIWMQTGIPRLRTAAPIIKSEAEQFIWARTASMNSCGTTGVKVPDSAAADQVINMNDKLYEASIKGDKFIPVEMSATKDMDPLEAKGVLSPQEFLQTYNSIDNFRLSTLGISNGGVFEKQGTILQSENATNSMNNAQILLDGLRLRQDFCCIFNQLFGTTMWCELNDELQQMMPPTDVQGRSETVDATISETDTTGAVGGEPNE